MKVEGPRRVQSISDLIPAGMFVGTSLILPRSGCFLYGIRPPRSEGAHPVLELTGIGGSLEAEDESLTAGVLREAQEETGCSVRLLPCQETLVVHGQDHVESVVLEGIERPAAVVFRHHRTPPHQPWHQDHEGKGCLVVFLGLLEGQPQPREELPALVWLEPSLILDLARRDMNLQDLLDSGAELVEREPRLIPKGSRFRLTDSQEALVLALGDGALAFYERLVLA